MITDEILHQRHDDQKECLLDLMRKFQAEKEKEQSIFYSPQNTKMTESRYNFTRGKIVGILSCIIILKDELRRMGLIDDEDTKMVDQDRTVASQSETP